MKKKVLSIELEPTPYKFDLWNAFPECSEYDLWVIFTTSKNWAKDAGHDYQSLQKANFSFDVLGGKRIWRGFLAGWWSIRAINKYDPDLVVIWGYSTSACLISAVWCALHRKRFVLFVDMFNTGEPSGRLILLKQLLREAVRKFIFRTSDHILTSGVLGRQSAIEAGCAVQKVIDFPYVVDIARILADVPESFPVACIDDINSPHPVIFFSGRMIERKGLHVLLSALSKIPKSISWVLWVEGDGPLIEKYKDMAIRFGVAQRVKFLGFSQYSTHSVLLRESDIVVVPSLDDHWGIVVDESVQARKPVISTSATGAAVDRIQDGANGFLIRPGDEDALRDRLDFLLDEDRYRKFVRSLPSPAKTVTPVQNINTILNLL